MKKGTQQKRKEEVETDIEEAGVVAIVGVEMIEDEGIGDLLDSLALNHDPAPILQRATDGLMTSMRVENTLIQVRGKVRITILLVMEEMVIRAEEIEELKVVMTGKVIEATAEMKLEIEETIGNSPTKEVRCVAGRTTTTKPRTRHYSRERESLRSK